MNETKRKKFFGQQSALRKKHIKDFDNKILSVANKNPFFIDLLKNKKDGLKLSLEEVIDTETGEVYTNEEFFKVLNNLKPKKQQNEKQQINSPSDNLNGIWSEKESTRENGKRFDWKKSKFKR